jgi:nucleoid-associated protein YgaU
MSKVPILTALFLGVTRGGFASSVLAQTDPEAEGRIENRQDRDQPDPAASERQRDTEREQRQDTPPVGANRPDAGDRQARPDASKQMTGSSGEYVVKQGDTLADIAQRELGDAKQWKRIAQLNDIDDPKTLAAGKRLQIPEREERGTSPERSDPMGSDRMDPGQRDSGRQEPGAHPPLTP